MSAKHTPGPWEIVEDGFDEELHITCEARLGMIPVCKVNVGYDGPIEDEQQANANLMAAAPDMKQALILARLYIIGEALPTKARALEAIDEALAKGGAA